MLNRKNIKEIDKKKVNDLLDMTSKIMRVVYILLFIAVIYLITIVSKELNLLPFIITLLKVIFPLFMGIVIAWLFDPIVKFLCDKKMSRGFAVTFVYIVFLGLLTIILGMIIPLLSDQINDFVGMIPDMIEKLKIMLTKVLNPLSNIDGFDLNSFEKDLFARIGDIGIDLMNNLPTMTVNVIKKLFSGFGTILVSLVIGFYLLMSFDGVSDTLFTIIPKRFQKNSEELIDEMNISLRRFVTGAIIDSTIIFLISSICFMAIGLKAPLIFGLFCGITNIIPYAGPYIGGAPAVIVGLSQSPTIGILTFISIFVLQFIEGNFFQPLIMSKTTKLHPVTIILGLLVFGHFFGIIGMAISTPIIAVVKTIFIYFDQKYKFFSPEEEYEILDIENDDEEK